MRLAGSQSAAAPFEPEVMSQQKGEGTASLVSGNVALVPARSYTARCRRSGLEAGGWGCSMRKPRGTADDFLTISPRVRVLPIIHGSGDFAIRVREELLSRPYDCVAVPLPPSFQDDVEECIERLPTVSAVAQLDVDRDDAELGFSYVPIDPCQGVIAALRT